MGWQDSYNVLLQLFPQVDSRLIKGAALEHGHDTGAAADFILNEVLGPDDGILDVEQQRNIDHHGSSNFTQIETVEGKIVDAADSDSVQQRLTGASTGVPSEAVEECKIEVQTLQDGSELLSATCDSDDFRPSTGPHVVKASIPPETVQEYKIVAENIENCKLVPVSCNVEDGNSTTSSHSSAKVGFPGVSEDVGLRAVVQGDLGDSKTEVPAKTSSTCGSEGRRGSESGFDETSLKGLEQMEDRVDVEGSVGLAVTLDGDREASILIDLEDPIIEVSQLRENYQVQDVVIDNPVLDSINVPNSTYHNEAADSLDSMLSIEKSFTSVNGIDGGDWESLVSNSIDLTRMETLDDLVEEAKTDKEVLITSVEEIRALRLKTDQAEHAARQAKDEADRGGRDVLARVDEMRQILSRAREANAVHAGEVYGEKAVLTTEARELRSRLVQVKAEKAKALSALNEIKASLQARIDSANQDREAADLEKVTKEVLARDCLAKEEALLAKVAQESRDLDAEAEVCTKLREFLIDRGSIVDALQGEVAVLCEDADALKKDLDGMSLSCSGGYVHMLSRAGSDIFNSTGSRSGKFSELYGQPSESLVQPDSGAISSGSSSGSFTQRKVPGIQKSSSDKKSWSSLPSLLRALSGSQDLNSSTHSGHSSMIGSNSPGSSRVALIVNAGEESQYLGSGELTEDIKYPSSPSSITSPGVAQAEQEVYEAQMAMFPGEELELEYSGSHNLDIFRSEKANEPRVGSDDDDWHLLDPTTLGKRSFGSSSGSSIGK